MLFFHTTGFRVPQQCALYIHTTLFSCYTCSIVGISDEKALSFEDFVAQFLQMKEVLFKKN